MNIPETYINKGKSVGTNKYRVRWVERHNMSTIVFADSAEEALEMAMDEDSEYFLDVENIDAYGPADPDSYECVLVDMDQE